jgi:exodeoxyribonuclease VII small subunit
MTDLNIEKALTDLETIVNQLESDDVDLDEALKLFESGVKLSEQVQQKLATSELTIKQVIENTEGFSLEDFQL